MNAILTLALKDLRLLLRDARAAVILLLMPVVFILVLGVSLGEGFGQKAEDKVQVTVVNLDQGYAPLQAREAASWLMATPGTGPVAPLMPMALAEANQSPTFPVNQTWGERVIEDMEKSGDIQVVLVETEEEAKKLVRFSKRPAVLVLGPRFSEKVAKCSFLADGVNPFFQKGVDLKALDVSVERDETQPLAASIIDQVAQGTMLRVILPWMIGQAFEEIGDPRFIDMLANEKEFKVKYGFIYIRDIMKTFSPTQKKNMAEGLQTSLQNLFPKYDLTAKDWTKLTKSPPLNNEVSGPKKYEDVGGTGVLSRGAYRYKLLVPSYTVMFAFFLVLTVGWLFVAERRQGTMKRLNAAPLTRSQILLGKMIPCFLLSLFQGIFLLGAGKLLFDMSWGPQPLWLIPVVITTSIAAMGLAMFVAALARTETQVSIYGTLLVLVLAGLSGSLMGSRSLMPPEMQRISRVTPHAWALDAYQQLLITSNPELVTVGTACLVLTGFGVGFLLLAWLALKLE